MAKWVVSFEQKGSIPNVRKKIGLIVGMLTEQARQDWIKFAKEKLRTTKNIYIQGISEPHIRGNTGTITLTGWMPNALEEGKEPYDMKPGLLRGPKAKMGKNGPYNTVPFAIRTPGASGPGPMIMPNSIYSMAKQLQVGESMSLSTKLKGLGIRSRLSPDKNKWSSYTWKSSPFEGITKGFRFPGQGAGAKNYKTFRRVSMKSNPSSWVHPGFKASNLMEKAAGNLNKNFDAILNEVL